MSRNGEDIDIKAWGHPDDGKVVIYINRQAYDAMYRHGAAYPEREVGGILVGNVSSDSSGKHLVKIVGAIEAETAPGSQTEMQFIGEVWQQLVISAQRKYPNQKVVGWYHTHPGFGAFMSDDDVNSHRVAFSHPWHVAAVCDPIKNELCFFGWDGSEIKAIKGFYTYGVPAEVPTALSRRKRAVASQQKTAAFLIPALILVLALFATGGFFLSQWPPGSQTTAGDLFPAATADIKNGDNLTTPGETVAAPNSKRPQSNVQITSDVNDHFISQNGQWIQVKVTNNGNEDVKVKISTRFTTDGWTLNPTSRMEVIKAKMPDNYHFFTFKVNLDSGKVQRETYGTLEYTIEDANTGNTIEQKKEDLLYQ